MSVSIYYTAKRQHPLSTKENATIEQIVADADVTTQLEAYLETGLGYNWETFTIYESNAFSATIFQGATKLPNNSHAAIFVGLEHWLNTLSLIRRVIPDAEWHVHLDDTDIPWNKETQLFAMDLL